MDLWLNGKTVLITGGSRGIGLATARSFANEGANLVLVSRTAADLTAASNEILAQHPQIIVAVEPLDLARPGSAETLAGKYPGIDILVNNAGAIPGGDIEVIDEATWRTAWDLKVFGFINLTRAYYARMRERRAGVILNIIGAAGSRPRADYIVGSAGNASLMAFTQALGGASANHDVRVLGVNPGHTETQRLQESMQRLAQVRFGDAARWRELLKDLPFGRAAHAEEVPTWSYSWLPDARAT